MNLIALQASLPLAHRAFLRDGGHQRSVGLEDRAAGQAAAAARVRRVLGVEQPLVDAVGQQMVMPLSQLLTDPTLELVSGSRPPPRALGRKRMVQLGTDIVVEPDAGEVCAKACAMLHAELSRIRHHEIPMIANLMRFSDRDSGAALAERFNRAAAGVPGSLAAALDRHLAIVDDLFHRFIAAGKLCLSSTGGRPADSRSPKASSRCLSSTFGS